MSLYDFLRQVQLLSLVKHVSNLPAVTLELVTTSPIYFRLYLNKYVVGDLQFLEGDVVGIRPDSMAPFAYVEAVNHVLSTALARRAGD